MIHNGLKHVEDTMFLKCEIYVMEHCALFWLLYHDLSINSPYE